jgi:hypothetical protein
VSTNPNFSDAELFLRSIAEALASIEQQNRYAYTESHGEYGSITRRIDRTTGAVAELRFRSNPDQPDIDASDAYIHFWHSLLME